MATTIRATNPNQNSTGTAASVGAPTGTTTGDLVVVLCHANGQTTWTDNNGSTTFNKASITGDDGSGNYQPNSTAGQTGSVFWRRIIGGDPSTYNFTSGLSGRWACFAITFQNPNVSTVFDAGPAGGGNNDVPNTTSLIVNSLTTATDNAIHVTCAFVDGTGKVASSFPAGYSNNLTTTSGTGEGISISTKVITSHAATGTTTFSGWASDANFGISFAIKDIGVAVENQEWIVAIPSTPRLPRYNISY